MLKIVGLGNPGDKYEETPHNVGKRILEKIISKNKNNFLSKRYDRKTHSNIYSGFLDYQKVTMIIPETFMNLSGRVLAEFKNEKKETSFGHNQVVEKVATNDSDGHCEKKKKRKKEKIFDDIVVIHDDIDLPFGKVKIVFGSGNGGHNGLKDIEKVLGTKKYIRIKFGVGPLDFFGRLRKPKGKNAVSKYLTDKKLSKKYGKIIDNKIQDIEDILSLISKYDYKKAMNKFNGK